MGDGELVAEVRRRAYALDPESFVERRRRAEADRHTSLRPAPDTMAVLSALLSVKSGVAVHAALSAEADRAKAAGDPRSRGQIMADTLTSRVVSPGVAEAATGAPLMVNVVVSDQVLLGDPGSDGAAEVEGYGPVPGELLRSWIADHLEDRHRRLRPPALRDPRHVARWWPWTPEARLFPAKLAEFLRLRDRRCRTLYCDAPARDADHATAHADGGATSAANGQCLCEGCNIAKEALRLVRPTATGSSAHRRDHHPDRPHLRLGRAPAHPTRRPTTPPLGRVPVRRARRGLPLAAA